MKIAGTTALITGGSSGIGRACAFELARLGANLVLTGRCSERLREIAAKLPESRVQTICADLEDAAQLEQVCENARSWAGQIDVLINNAGAMMFSDCADGNPALIRRLFEINVLAPMEITRRLLPSIGSPGAIVNVASILADVAHPRAIHYSASKAALKSFSDGLRMEVKGRNIRVLCVYPGYVLTPMHQNPLAGAVPPRVSRQRLFCITAERCARDIVQAVRSGKECIVTPPVGWTLVLCTRLFPRLVYRWMESLLRRDRAENVIVSD